MMIRVFVPYTAGCEQPISLVDGRELGLCFYHQKVRHGLPTSGRGSGEEKAVGDAVARLRREWGLA